jgi:hypothetical protein
MATTSIGAPGVTFPDGTVQASSGATGNVVMNVYTSSSTWTKPTAVKAIRVTVVGGGGNGGSATNSPGNTIGAGGGGGGGTSIKLYPAPSLPGPQPYTVGGAGATSSFGGTAPVISATGGATGASYTLPAVTSTSVMTEGGSGGSGSSGNLNFGGGGGNAGSSGQSPSSAEKKAVGGTGGSSYFGGGGRGVLVGTGLGGNNYGGGGGGGARGNNTGTAPGGAGAQGVVIVEEFY